MKAREANMGGLAPKRPLSRLVRYGSLGLVFAASLLAVPFDHRTLTVGPDGRFGWTSERVFAPLWSQPSFESGVAEYPFAWLLGVWAALLVTVLVAFVLGRVRGRSSG